MSPTDTKGAKTTKHPGIKKLKDGRWLVTKSWVDKRTGRRTYREKVVSGSLDEAQGARAKLSPESKGDKQPRPRFRDFASAWVERHEKRAKLAPSTAERYRGDVAQLCVEWGDWWVDAIDVEAIEQWQAEVSTQYAAPTCNGWLRTLRLVLDSAKARRLVMQNWAREVSTVPEGRTKGPRGTTLSAKHLRAFVDAAPTAKIEIPAKGGKPARTRPIPEDRRRAMLVMAWTGIRAGELVALRWEDDVDGELHIERAVWRGYEKATKTDDPRRITVTAPLRAVLDEQRQWLLTTQHPGLVSGLVFPAAAKQAAAGASRRKGELHWYQSQSPIQAAVKATAKAAKVPDISPHALRRTFEDLLREAGVDQIVRRAVAGWREDDTQGIYATVSRAERDAAAGSLVRLVLG
jgi:integrase